MLRETNRLAQTIVQRGQVTGDSQYCQLPTIHCSQKQVCVKKKRLFMIETISRILEMPLKDDQEAEPIVVKNEEIHSNDVVRALVGDDRKPLPEGCLIAKPFPI